MTIRRFAAALAVGAFAGTASAQPAPETAALPALAAVNPAAVAYETVPAVSPEKGPISYEIYFRTDFSTLDAVALEKVSIIADAAIAGGVGVAVIVGATDTVAPADYNLSLAEERAETVRENLIARGVPREVIETRVAGEALLAAPTPDETPEALNRRAIVTLDAFGVLEPPDIDRPFSFEVPPLITP